jgi:D-glycero-D-manno-heptose 1,7-bisphosphate phosphatase
MPLSAPRPAIFLDRDGVLNVRRSDHVKSLAEFEFIPGALDALSELDVGETPVVVVTNQSVIGRGLASHAEVDIIHAHLREAMLGAGVQRLSIYVCPHAPKDGCECRKPRPGLLLRAASELNLDLKRSVMIGDSITDAQAGMAAGCYPILVGNFEGTIACVADLGEAVRLIRGRAEFSRSRN